MAVQMAPASVQVGKRFRLEPSEIGELKSCLTLALNALEQQHHGWQVLVVQEILRAYKVTRRAVLRSHAS